MNKKNKDFFIKIPEWFFDSLQNMSGSEVKASLGIARYININSGKAWASRKTLMRVSGINSVETYSKALRAIKQRGLIKVTKRVGNTNIYEWGKPESGSSINQDSLKNRQGEALKTSSRDEPSNGPVRIKEKKTRVKDNNSSFKKPTIQDIHDYIQLKGFDLEAEQFYDYYESNGWRIGRNKMKDWKATLRNWARNPIGKDPKTKRRTKLVKDLKAINYERRNISIFDSTNIRSLPEA